MTIKLRVKTGTIPARLRIRVNLPTAVQKVMRKPVSARKVAARPKPRGRP
jgi:hypothetical protein